MTRGDLRREAVASALLVALLAAIDALFRWLHPVVDFERASLVGATAAVALLGARHLLGLRTPDPWRGTAAIATAAFASVALIERGVLVSRSPLSAAVHAALVVAVYAATGRALLTRRGEERVGRAAG